MWNAKFVIGRKGNLFRRIVKMAQGFLIDFLHIYMKYVSKRACLNAKNSS